MTVVDLPLRSRPASAPGKPHVVICNWRDLRHPEGGGSELYVETVARGLAASGHRVTLLTARVEGQPADEDRDGVHYRRRGGRRSVYLAAAWALLTRRVRPDVVVDVQNGVPFLSPLVTRRPVVVLVHHVHREQWPIVFGKRTARLGWWVESRVAPRLYRNARYVTVSEWTRRDLEASAGVDPSRVQVIHNGTSTPPHAHVSRSATPRVVVLGRLVPHKRVEIALRAVARLRAAHPGLQLDIVGQGYWEPMLREEAGRLGLDDAVTFHGFVSEQSKVDLLAAAWVNAVPSVKEGWALSVVEAGRQGTPSIAFHEAGGVGESIIDGVTGLLVSGGEREFTHALEDLLSCPARRKALGQAATTFAASFSWGATIDRFAEVLDGAIVPLLPASPSAAA